MFVYYAVSVYTKEEQLHRQSQLQKKYSSERKKLIKTLDRLVSQIVVLRDKECVTCGSDVLVHCGHFHSRQHFATRWDLENCHAQCDPCNLRHEHDPYPYTRFMLKKYGAQKMDELYLKFRSATRYKKTDLLEMKADLENILNNLLNTK